VKDDNDPEDPASVVLTFPTKVVRIIPGRKIVKAKAEFYLFGAEESENESENIQPEGDPTHARHR